MSRRYLTTRQLDVLRVDLRDVDWDVLRTLARVRVATGLQLQRVHHGLGDAAKQRRIRQLARLSRRRLITRLARRIGGLEGGSMSSVYCLDIAGQRLLSASDRARAPWTPSTPFLAHALAVTELFVGLCEEQAAGSLELLDFATEPDAWRAFVDRHGERVVLKADAHVVVAAGDYEHHWFCEIDRATESPRRILGKSRLYVAYWHSGLEQVRHDVFPRVLWVAPDESRRTELVDTVAMLDAHDWHIFAVATVEDAVAVMSGHVQSAIESEPRP
jgi:hypothetical protein